jgi:hypothetical protein
MVLGWALRMPTPLNVGKTLGIYEEYIFLKALRTYWEYQWQYGK